MSTLFLRGGLVGGRTQDIAIRDERIHTIGSRLDASGAEILDVHDRLVLPGFVESHIHPDKAYIADRTRGLSAGGPTPQTLVAELKKSFTVDDVYARAHIDWFFETAQAFGVPLDFPAASCDDPAHLTTEYIAEQTIARGMQ